MAVQGLKHRFTVEDYQQIARAGVLRDGDRVELIDGEIVDMAPIGSEHNAAVDALNRRLTPALAERAIARVQGSIRLSGVSLPQPDLAVLKPRRDFYRHEHPGPGDILLVVEVADTSLDYDRGVKLGLYAAAGIPDVWIVNLRDAMIEVYSTPAPTGYSDVEQFHRGARVSVRAFPEVEVSVDEIVG